VILILVVAVQFSQWGLAALPPTSAVNGGDFIDRLAYLLLSAVVLTRYPVHKARDSSTSISSPRSTASSLTGSERELLDGFLHRSVVVATGANQNGEAGVSGHVHAVALGLPSRLWRAAHSQAVRHLGVPFGQWSSSIAA
jgi:hypothetical protein